MNTLTVTITYDDTETTPDYLLYHIGAADGVTDIEAHAPYAVVLVDTDEPVAILPNRQSAQETEVSLTGDYYVTPDFSEDKIQYEQA